MLSASDELGVGNNCDVGPTDCDEDAALTADTAVEINTQVNARKAN